MVALYARVSTDAQAEEGYSIDVQKERLEAHCKAKGYERYEFYIDPGETGANLERPDMQRLIKDCEAGRLTNVVVYKLDRLSRNLRDTLYLIEDIFDKNGVKFTSIEEAFFDTTSDYGKVIISIISLFSQLERSMITQRTKMGRAERAKEGKWHGGGVPPYGYNYVPGQGLVANERAGIVGQVFELYVSGTAPNRIQKLLGFTNERVVIQILQNKVSAGYITWNGETYKGQHEPIVSEELFNEAQRVMQSRRRKWDSGAHLLAGMIYCGRCGAKYRHQKWGKAGVRIYCYSQQKSKASLVKDAGCDNNRHWSGAVEAAVLAEIRKIRLEDSALLEEPGLRLADSADTLRTQIDKISRQIINLIDFLSLGIETSVTRERIAKLSEEKKRLLEQLSQEERRSEHDGRIKKLIKNVQDSWEVLAFRERRLLLQQLIDRIVIDGDNINIIWRDFDTNNAD